MTPDQIDQEIAKRQACLSRAERTIADTHRAPYVSEPTTKALAELVKVVAAERVVLAELRKYRSALTV